VRLFEFADTNDDNSLRVKLTGIVSQLIGRLGDTNTKNPYSLKALLTTLNSNGISVSPEQFRNMIEEEPLKNLIANVQGDNVVFKGQSSSDSEVEAPDDSTSTLKKMANRAEKKRK
jgi:hypothetical protein